MLLSAFVNRVEFREMLLQEKEEKRKMTKEKEAQLEKEKEERLEKLRKQVCTRFHN